MSLLLLLRPHATTWNEEVALDAAAAFAAGVTQTIPQAVILAAAGGIAPTSKLDAVAAAAAAAAGAVSGLGRLSAEVAAMLAAAGGFAPSAKVAHAPGATVAGAGAISPAMVLVVPVSATIAPGAAVGALARLLWAVATSAGATGQASAVPGLLEPVSASVGATGSAAALATLLEAVAASVGVVGAVVPTPGLVQPLAFTLAAGGNVLAEASIGAITYNEAVALEAGGGFTVATQLQAVAAALLAGIAGVAPVGRLDAQVSAAIAVGGAIAAEGAIEGGAIVWNEAITFSAIASLVAAAQLQLISSAAIGASPAVGVAPSLIISRSAPLEALASVEASVARTCAVQLALEAAAGFSASTQAQVAAVLQLAATGALSVRDTATQLVALGIPAQAAVIASYGIGLPLIRPDRAFEAVAQLTRFLSPRRPSARSEGPRVVAFRSPARVVRFVLEKRATGSILGDGPMILGTLTKQPSEELDSSVDFGPRLAVGETISAVDLKAKKRSDGTDATSTIIQGTPQIVGGLVLYRVKAGADGEDYELTFKITTSTGEHIEDEVMLAVREV